MNTLKSIDFPHEALTAWYQTHGRRTLPWRNTNNPYHIYISEIMLQQTQVRTVLERYYTPFLERFPTLQALAESLLEEVLKAWEGLGYYTRARNLHKAAQLCTPALPETVDGLMTLPGIGRNTAHAIAAFAYHQPVPVMEANVKRVLHRLVASPKLREAEIWALAQQCVNCADPFTHNQAMMDIGALICTPTNPACHQCPLADVCEGKTSPQDYPAPKAKKRIPVRHKYILVPTDGERLYLTPRHSAFLGGLYGFPEYDPAATLSFDDQHYEVATLEHLGQVRQTYSHFQLDAQVYQLSLNQDESSPDGWHHRDAIGHLPLSQADQKVLRLCRLKRA